MTAPRKPGTRFGGKRKPASSAAKRRRELALLDELQRDHGYMFARMPRERDSYTTQVRGIKSGKLTMTSARVMRVIVPDESALAAHSDPKRARKVKR